MLGTNIRTKVVIVGAGFGGLGMGVALKKAGHNDFIIIEKGSDVGGVWRDNSYPGCTCDVPSHLYSFSFAPYRRCDKRFPPQQDILAYLQKVATDFGLDPHIRLNTPASKAQFCDDTNSWQVETASGQSITAQVVIFAVGQLHIPKIPHIPGLEDFTGPVFHSAKWGPNVDLRGKRISIIGTGSSGSQLLPTLASVASHVNVFQRTPRWILPKMEPEFSSIERTLLQIPGAHHVYRKLLMHGADLLVSPVTRRPLWRRIVEHKAKSHFHRHIPAQREELRRQLTPKYPMGSNRILFDNTFYPTLLRPNVSLTSSHITRIHRNGIETASGTLTETDVLILATGFRASDFLIPISVTGRHGHDLNADWRNGAEAYLGTAVHGYPNLFLIAGPNSFNPAGSNPEMKDVQVGFIMRCLGMLWGSGNEREREVDSDGVGLAMEVREGVVERYKVWLEGKMSKTVWGKEKKGEADGAKGEREVPTWFKHESGKVTNPWPGSLRTFKKKLREKPEDAFDLIQLRRLCKEAGKEYSVVEKCMGD